MRELVSVDSEEGKVNGQSERRKKTPKVKMRGVGRGS